MMRPDAKVEKVYLYPKPVDFRKSIDGLAALVELDIKVAVFDPVLFVFLNKPRNRVKILYWERNGFCLWLKRLESERFKTSPDLTDEAIVLSEYSKGKWEIGHPKALDKGTPPTLTAPASHVFSTQLHVNGTQPILESPVKVRSAEQFSKSIQDSLRISILRTKCRAYETKGDYPRTAGRSCRRSPWVKIERGIWLLS